MQISLSEVRGLFSKALVAVFSSKMRTTNFLRSFFKENENDSLNVSIQVRQGTTKISVDVLRGTDGNMNASSISSEKIIQPPYYEEKIAANELDFYDKVFGTEAPSPATVARYAKNLSNDMLMLKDKIDRSIELQCSQVLVDGVVKLKKATNIDFKRKAGSIQASALNDWLVGTNDPSVDFIKGAKFIRENANSSAATFDVIMDGDAFEAMINNETFQKKCDLKDVDLNKINMPQATKEATGSFLHGTVSAGSF